MKRHPHSIRFSQEEWETISRAAVRHVITPGEFVRKAAIRDAAENDGLTDVPLTPELVELIRRTFRGVHVLAFLKREQLGQAGRQDQFDSAAMAARTAQSATLQAGNPSGTK